MDVDLSQARRRAKELLRAARAGDRQALGRMREDRAPRLADAQRAVAGELGFSSWPELVRHVEAAQGDREERRRRLVGAALNGREDMAERLLAHDPSLAAAGLDVWLVIGDADRVAEALEADPGLVSRELPDVGRLPLSCACHSAFLKPSSARVEGVRQVVRLLLDRGADPNEVHHNEYGAMSVLYGAAGVGRDPVTMRLLLERGADPDDGESVYHAVEADDTTCLEILLEHGASVRDTNALGNAIRSPRKVRLLLERGNLRPSDPELRDSLLYAVEDEVVAMLIEHGAALDVRDRDGLTAYARAARRGDHPLMELLARAGAPTELDPVAEWLGAVLNGEERAGELLARQPGLPSRIRPADAELLPMFASAGADAKVGRLLDAGLPLDARGIDNGTALHYAGMWGRGSTVALLIERGAEIEATAGPREAPEGTPLGWTAWGSRALPEAELRLDGYLEAAGALIAAGARVTQDMADTATDELSLLLEEALAGPRG